MLPLQADKPNLENNNNLKQTIMKKFFTLIAAVAMAASVNAQTITFTEYAKGAAPKTVSNGSLVLTITDTNKTSVDKNSQYFGTADSYVKFDTRFKSGGKTSISSSTKLPTNNYLTINLPSDGTLKVYARTGSIDATDRNIVLTQDGTELVNKVLLESEAVKVNMEIDGQTVEKNVYPVVSVAAKAGDVVITYPTNSVNIYGIELATATGVSSVSVAEAKAKTATYNLAGQQVSESYKGIVVKNGKKYLNK